MFKLIIGLGNPGPDYRHTYHNAGALFADYLIGDAGSRPPAPYEIEARCGPVCRASTGRPSRFHPGPAEAMRRAGMKNPPAIAYGLGHWWTGTKLFEYARLPGNIILIKPLIFMNDSGAAVRSALKYFKIRAEELLLAHDDSDISLGKYKLSFGRGAGGHKGVESAIRALGGKNFWRLRFGIRTVARNKTTRTAQKAGDFVLKNISEASLKKLYSAFADANANVIENDTLPPPMGVKEVSGN